MRGYTLAESVSLHSVCHDALYFEYSYNLVHLLQSKDRIHRLGLPEGQYTQYTYLQLMYETEDGSWSMDSDVLHLLQEKEQTMLQAIDNQVLEILPSSEEDLELIFGKLKNIKTTIKIHRMKEKRMIKSHTTRLPDKRADVT